MHTTEVKHGTQITSTSCRNSLGSYSGDVSPAFIKEGNALFFRKQLEIWCVKLTTTSIEKQ